MAELLSTLSIISFSAAGVFFVLAVVLFIYYGIPTVIGDLSGRNAKKSIAQMRNSNEKSGNKSYRASATNAARGKLTGTMHGIANLQKKEEHIEKTPEENRMPETGLIAENKADRKEELTALLDEAEETALLTETAIESVKKRSNGVKLTTIDEVVLIHTNEVIE